MITFASHDLVAMNSALFCTTQDQMKSFTNWAEISAKPSKHRFNYETQLQKLQLR
jgi:hypothetical protein